MAPTTCYSTAKELWDSINEMYSDVSNKSQVYELTLRIGEIKQGGESITKYFNNLKRIWQDLDVYNTYEWKSTEDAKYHCQVVEEGRIFKFLVGLDDELDEVQARIIGRGDLPSIGEVFFEVRREETRRSVMLGKSKKMEIVGPETTALVAAESAAYKSNTLQQRKLDEKDRLWCDFCNKPRHTQETCWKLNGQPPQKGN